MTNYFALYSKTALFMGFAISISACQPSNSNPPAKTNTNQPSGVSQATPSSQTTLQSHTKTVLSQTTLNDLFTVYRDPNCGCCHEWIAHAKDYQLNIEDKVLADNMAVSKIKDQQHVPTTMRSCHTVVSKSGYVFEGHVPTKYIDEFLKNPPKNSIGLAVAGMPVGSPGMEVGDKFNPYPVMLLNKDGSTSEYVMVQQARQQL